MEKIALIAGCSHSAGSEIDGTEDSPYNRNNTFGNLLAKRLGYRPINIALNGATNAGIARSILEWFDERYDHRKMTVFVIVGWTESVRMEVPVNWPTWYNESNPAVDWFSKTSTDYLRVNMGWKGSLEREIPIIATHQEFMAENSNILELVSANAVLQIQYFLKSKQIEYVMCNTLHMFTPGKHIDFYMNRIDHTRYMDLADNDLAFYWYYRNQGHLNPKAKFWHHGEEPHKLYSDKLFSFIENNQIPY